MRIVRSNSTWYWPCPGRRTIWRGVIIVILVFVLSSAAGYGEAVLGALAAAGASAAATEITKAIRRERPRSA